MQAKPFQTLAGHKFLHDLVSLEKNEANNNNSLGHIDIWFDIYEMWMSFHREIVPRKEHFTNTLFMMNLILSPCCSCTPPTMAQTF